MPRFAPRLLARLLLLGALAVPSGPGPLRAAAAAAVTEAPEGIWKGRFTGGDGTARDALAFVLASAKGRSEARLVMDDGSLAAFSLTAGGQGSGTFFPQPGDARAFSCRLREVRAKTGFSGSYWTTGGEAGIFTFTEYLSLYEVPTDLKAMAGAYASGARQNSRGQELQLTLERDGRFKVSGPGGLAMAGSLALPDPSKSAFRVSYRIAEEGQARREGSGVGYFFVSPRSAGRTLLVTSSHGGQGLLAMFAFQSADGQP